MPTKAHGVIRRTITNCTKVSDVISHDSPPNFPNFIRTIPKPSRRRPVPELVCLRHSTCSAGAKTPARWRRARPPDRKSARRAATATGTRATGSRSRCRAARGRRRFPRARGPLSAATGHGGVIASMRHMSALKSASTRPTPTTPSSTSSTGHPWRTPWSRRGRSACSRDLRERSAVAQPGGAGVAARALSEPELVPVRATLPTVGVEREPRVSCCFRIRFGRTLKAICVAIE